MKLRSVVVVLGLCVSSSSLLVDVLAYDRNVHFDVTYYLGRAAGLTEDDAIAIASADQGIDDDLKTGPYLYYSARRRYHFTTQAQRDSLKNAAIKTCSRAEFGGYLHAFEDEASHRGFGPKVGHYRDPAPDDAWRNVPKALEMIANKYKELIEFKQTCKLKSLEAPRVWNDFEPVLRKYLANDRPSRLTYP